VGDIQDGSAIQPSNRVFRRGRAHRGRPHERTGERATYRNGYRMRTWDTRMGTIELAIPKLRTGTYLPSLLQPRRRAEHALLAVVQEAYVHGVSTRKVDHLVKAPGVDGLSKSEVSRICAELDTAVAVFRTRALTGEHRYLWVDATYRKVRVDGRVISQATVVAVGSTSDGDRQVLGVEVRPSEDRAFWTAFLRSLVKRELKGGAPGHLRRARGPDTGDWHRAEWHDVAAVSRALHAEPAGHGTARRPRSHRRHRPDDLRATRPRLGHGAAP